MAVTVIRTNADAVALNESLSQVSASVSTINSTVLQITAPGIIAPYAGIVVPSGWLACDGSAVSRTTYSALFNSLSLAKGTVSITIGDPAIIQLNNHGLKTGAAIYFTTTGNLPTGIIANTTYYAIYRDDNSIRLATSLANALSDTRIVTSGTQSGTHTLVFCPYGNGNGTTTFNVPNLKGKTLVGIDTSQSEFASSGIIGGTKTHTLSESEMPVHKHTITDTGHAHSTKTGQGHDDNNGINGQGANIQVVQESDIPRVDYYSSTTNIATGISINNSGGTGGITQPHNNLQPYISINYIIKY